MSTIDQGRPCWLQARKLNERKSKKRRVILPTARKTVILLSLSQLKKTLPFVVNCVPATKCFQPQKIQRLIYVIGASDTTAQQQSETCRGLLVNASDASDACILAKQHKLNFGAGHSGGV